MFEYKEYAVVWFERIENPAVRSKNRTVTLTKEIIVELDDIESN